MSKFRKRPIVIEAMELGHSPASLAEICEWAERHGAVLSADHDGKENHCLCIQTLEGVMIARVGDWVIKGVKGEFYPCRDDIFQATYEAVE